MRYGDTVQNTNIKFPVHKVFMLLQPYSQNPTTPTPSVNQVWSTVPAFSVLRFQPSLSTQPTMAEPQPPTIQPGAEGLDEPENPTAAPASAEDRKAAAALSTLDAHDDDSATSKPSSNVDQKALGDAMSKLSVGGAGKAGAEKKGPEAGEEKEKKKVIKVDQADVTLLVCRPMNV